MNMAKIRISHPKKNVDAGVVLKAPSDGNN